MDIILRQPSLFSGFEDRELNRRTKKKKTRAKKKRAAKSLKPKVAGRDIDFNTPSESPKDFSKRKLAAKILLLGGGVQSGTIVEMICEGAIERPDLVVFSDTGDEPWWVYSFVGRYRGRLSEVGVELLVCTRDCASAYKRYGSLKRDLMYGAASTSLPLFVKDRITGKRGRLRRQCTTDYKIEPNNRAIRHWLWQHGYATATGTDFYGYDRVCRVKPKMYAEMWFGISTDEMYRATERGPKWQKTRYPLIEQGMTRDDCIAWLTARNLPIPKKSACSFCPYKSDESWLWLKQFDFEVFEDVCQFDDWLRSPAVSNSPSFAKIRGELYLHYSCVPLRDIDFEALIAVKQARKKSTSPVEHDMAGELMFDVCSTDGAWSCFS